METESPSILTIENGNWGATSLRAIRGVLNSASDVLLAAFGREPEAAIQVAPWRRAPQVSYDLRPYRMWLSARDTYWCQYVYQFAHELCHVMTHFDRYRDHRHRWFTEALCELASLFVLQRLATVWAENPPDGVAEAAAYAPHFATYAARVADRYSRPGDLPRWLAHHLPELEGDPYVRERNGVMAVNLLQPVPRRPHSLARLQPAELLGSVREPDLPGLPRCLGSSSPSRGLDTARAAADRGIVLPSDGPASDLTRRQRFSIATGSMASASSKPRMRE